MTKKVKISELKALAADESTAGLYTVGSDGEKNVKVPLDRFAESKTISEALGLKAPLASPTFTGTPKAPTPVYTNNSTQIATTAFVKNVLANSPALNGTPTAPTAAKGTNSTQIATTAFVQSAVAGVSGGGSGDFEALKPSISIVQRKELCADEGGMPEPIVMSEQFIGREFILWRYTRGRRSIRNKIEDSGSNYQALPKMERVLLLSTDQRPLLFKADNYGFLVLENDYEGKNGYMHTAGESLGNFIYYNELGLLYADNGEIDSIKWRGQYGCKIIGSSVKRLSKYHKSSLFAISPADGRGGLVYMRYYLTMAKKNSDKGGLIEAFVDFGIFVRATTAVAWR